MRSPWTCWFEIAIFPLADEGNYPDWLHALSYASLLVAGVCATIIVVDLLRHPQTMWIMNLVWPLTALFGSVMWLAAYWRWGRTSLGGQNGVDDEPPFPAAVLKGASHCGAGCTLGDIIAESTLVALPVVAVWFGYGSLFAREIYAAWVLDFLVAFILGIGFQYFTLKPMRDLTVGQAVWQAIKADTASISSWQIGMYGTMAFIQFVLFLPAYGALAKADTPEFWFAMQFAMLAGFCTAYPVNWLLIRHGVKERM